MRLLAFDTSGPALSAAVFEGKRLIAEVSSDTAARHSSALLPAIEAVLKKARWSMDDVDAVAVGLGPGSFTGLRVGIATAKMFGYALKKRLIGVSSLEAMAMRWEGEGRLAAMLDARRSQVYASLYERKGERLKVLRAPALMDRARFDRFSKGAKVIDAAAVPADARGVALAALARAGKKGVDPFVLEPLYLRPRDCNVTAPKK